MKYKQIISKINKKKQNHEEFYEDLLLLEKEVNHCESLVKAQVLYFLGVDFLFYQDFKKALELQYDSLDLLINLVYTTREIEIVHFTIQKVIIEISKIYKKSLSDGKESLSDSRKESKSDRKESKESDSRKGKESNTKASKSNDNESDIDIIKSFYFNLKIPFKHDLKLLNLIREFQEVKRVFPDNNEIFIYLLQENPRECLDFMTTDKQIDLLVDKLKTDFDFEVMKKLKLKNIQNLNNDDQRMDPNQSKGPNNQSIDPNQSTNHIININQTINPIITPKSLINLLILFLIYDKDHFNDHLSQLRSLIIKSPSLIPILLTSCVSLSKIDILPEIVSLLPEEIKKNIKILYSDIYKVFSEEMDLDDLIDLEQVVHFWFTTGQYKKILKIEKKVCKKLRFISKMREEREDWDVNVEDRDVGDRDVEDRNMDKDDMDNGDRDKEYVNMDKDRECVNRDKDSDMEDNPYNYDSDSDLDKIGFTWNLENDYVLEKIKLNLKNKKYEKIKKMTREVKDLEILIKILGMVKEKMEDEEEGDDYDGREDEEEEDDVDILPSKKIKPNQGHPKKNENDLVSLPSKKTKPNQKHHKKNYNEDVVSLPNTKTKSNQEDSKQNNKNKDLVLHKITSIKPSLLLKDILLDCFNRKDILFQGLKVFISYLHLKDLDFGVFDRLRICGIPL